MDPQQQGVATPVMPSQPLQATSTGLVYSGFWRRYAASFLDGIIVGGVIYTLKYISLFLSLAILLRYPNDMAIAISINLIVSVLTLVLAFGYYIFMTCKYQATLGKMAVGIKVMNIDGGRLTTGQVWGRELGKIVSSLIFLIGYIMAAFTQKKQALHDMMAGSVVVFKDPANKHTGAFVTLLIIGLLLPVMAVAGFMLSVVFMGINQAREMASYASSTQASMPISFPANQ